MFSYNNSSYNLIAANQLTINLQFINDGSYIIQHNVFFSSVGQPLGYS